MMLKERILDSTPPSLFPGTRGAVGSLSGADIKCWRVMKSHRLPHGSAVKNPPAMQEAGREPRV